MPIDSRQFLHDINTILVQSFKDRSAESKFVFTRCCLVHNAELSRDVSGDFHLDIL